jgi:RNA polymerase sigma-70 factor (ECF subfamily)
VPSPLPPTVRGRGEVGRGASVPATFLTRLPRGRVRWAMIAAVREEDPSETDWLARCRAGDDAAWRRLYDHHFPLVFRLSIRMGASEREAADVAQEVFLRVWRGLGSFRGDSLFRTWLYRITLNEVSRVARDGAVRRAFGAVLALVSREEAPPARSPDRLMEQAEAFAELEAILARMKAKQRTVFVLFEVEELSLEQIAEVLDCPLETVRSRLRHARADFERLRRQRALARGETR